MPDTTPPESGSKRTAQAIVFFIVIGVLGIVASVIILPMLVLLGLRGNGENQTNLSNTSGQVACVKDLPKNFVRDANAYLNTNIPDYKAAASAGNVPWEVLAAIHYRENNFERGFPKNGQGPFQLTTIFEHNPGDPALKDFQASAVAAAKFLNQEKAGGKLTQATADPATLQRAIYNYNGVKYPGGIATSPYVFNLLDQDHQNMFVASRAARDGTPTAYAKDPRMGAWPVYLALKRATYDASGKLVAFSDCPELNQPAPVSPQTQNGVANAAIHISDTLQKTHKPSIYGNHDSYLYNYSPEYPNVNPLKGTAHIGQFICTYLVIFSYTQAGLTIPHDLLSAEGMREWFTKNQIYIPNGTGPPQPGDAIFFTKSEESGSSGHVGIIVGVTDTTVTTREANSGSRGHELIRKGDTVSPKYGQSGRGNTEPILGWGRLK